MKIKKHAKNIGHKIAKTTSNATHAVSKVAGNHPAATGVAVGAGIGVVTTGWAFRFGYSLGVLANVFNMGSEFVDDED